MGFSSSLWRAFERFMCHCSAVADARRGYGFFEVHFLCTIRFMAINFDNLAQCVCCALSLLWKLSL